MENNKSVKTLLGRICNPKVFLFIVLVIQTTSTVMAYTFSAVCPSGQTLYYIISGSNVTVTSQYSSSPYYYSAPTGNLTIPSSVSYCGITYAVTSIGYRAFYDCYGLTSVTIPNTVTTIGDYAFYYCEALTSVTMGNSVTSIGSHSFEDCYRFTSITLPNTVTTIGDYAFCHCDALTSLTMGDSVTSIGSHSFENCYGFTSITIPNSVTTIGDYAFASCTGLTSVTIPDSVTVISDCAFNGCEGLTNVTMGNHVTTIGMYAFLQCNSLTSVVIPNSVATIDDGAFCNCANLTNVTIGDSVTIIGDYAFERCSLLDTIISNSSVAPLLGTNAFYGVGSTIYVGIPCGSLSSYTSTWSHFSSFVEYLQYDVTVNSADESQGSVTILTPPTCSDPEVEVSAVPAIGFAFSHWSNGSTDNPYAFTLTQDTFLTAFFVTEYSITVSTNDSLQGVVSGAGAYRYGDTAVISALAAEHHHFVQWSDGSTDNPRYVVVVNDSSFNALFGIDTITVTLLSNDNLRGEVSGSGEYEYGEIVTATATALSGYMFSKWDNDNTDNPYSFVATEDLTLIAIFVEEDQEGIALTEPTCWDVSVTGSAIRVGGAEGKTLTIVDAAGRILIKEKSITGKDYMLPSTGVYFVQVGNHPAKKVVVAR